MKQILIWAKDGSIRDLVFVDDEDFEYLNQFRWSLPSGYAGRTITVDGKRSAILMHREIMGCTKGDGQEVDHIDGNRLNNQRSNLRLVTRTQNHGNCRHRDNCSSKFKGVTLVKRTGKWQAQITCNYKDYYLGSFMTETDAALAYNKKALELFGEHAKLNIIPKEAA